MNLFVDVMNLHNSNYVNGFFAVNSVTNHS